MAKEPSRQKTGPRTRKILGVQPGEATDEVASLYRKAKKPVVRVTHTAYANLAFIQVSARDVFIDFIEAPGTPQREEIDVPVVRVYMPHVAAKSLAEVLERLLIQMKKSGKLESFDNKPG